MTAIIDSVRSFAPSLLAAGQKPAFSPLAVGPDTAAAESAADALARARGVPRAGLTAPQLQAPQRHALDAAQAQTLLLPADENSGDGESASAALAALLQAALRSLDAPTQLLIAQSGGTVPRELLATAPFVAVKEALQKLTGLVSGNGAIAQPSVRDLAALSGTAPPSTPETEALRRLLEDAPEVRQAIDELATLEEEELPLRLTTDPRLSYVLLLVAMLMSLAATQREQAASMLLFAEKSIQDMGSRMIDSAKQQQLAKIVSLAVVVVASVAAVGLGASMAGRNVNSFRGEQTKVNQLNAKAASLEADLAKGSNLVRADGGIVTAGERQSIRADINAARGEAAELSASHSINLTNNAVGMQASQAIGQGSNSAGQVAGSGHEIEAAQLTAQQEKRRNDAATEQQVNQSTTQNAGKLDESGSALFRQAQQAEQDRADTRNDIARRLR